MDNLLIKKRFGAHRGNFFRLNEQNSLKAIKLALAKNPLFIEFDVEYDGERIKTGHPPQSPLDTLEEILTVFRGKKTFPKIDIKLRESQPYSKIIDMVLDIIQRSKIRFALLNIDGIKNKDFIMRVEKYLALKIRNNKIKLNIDLSRYKDRNEKITEEIKKHVLQLNDAIYSISPEIHEENIKETLQFAKNYNIKNIQFWLRGWPKVINPKIKEKEIRKAMQLEKRYGINIYFDINPDYVEK